MNFVLSQFWNARTRKMFFFILILSRLTFSAEWECIGPWSGDISAFYGFGDTIFCGLDNGVLCRSFNNGESWNPITTKIPNKGIRAIARQKNKMYLCFAGSSLEQCVYSSSDYGTTWNASGSLKARAYNIFIKDPYIYICSLGNIYRSIDAGITWVKADSGITPTTSEVAIMDIASIDSTLYAVTYNGIFISDNNGNSWLASSAGLSTGNSKCCNSIAVLDTTIFIGTLGGPYTSTNRGKSWNRIDLTSTTAECYGLNDSIIIVSVEPENSHYISYDKGTTWKRDTLTPTGFTTNCFYSNNDSLFAGTTIGVFKSSDLGISWHQSNFGIRCGVGGIALCKGNIWAFPEDFPAFHKMKNNPWHHDMSIKNDFGDNKMLFFGAASVDTFLFVLPVLGISYRYNYAADTFDRFSTNNETSKRPKSFTATNNDITARVDSTGANPLEPLIIYYKSAAPFTEWRAITPPLNPKTNSFKFNSNNNRFYAYQSELTSVVRLDSLTLAEKPVYCNRIFRLDENEINWTEMSIRQIPDSSVHSFGIVQGNAALTVASVGNDIFLTDDHCATWKKISSGLPPSFFPTRIIVDSNNNIYIVNRLNSVYISTDEGTSWFVSSINIPDAEIIDLQIDSTTLYAGTYAHSIWTLDVSDLIATGNEHAILTEKRVSPNLSIQKTFLTYTLPQSAFVQLSIFDIQGKMHSRVVNEYQHTGTYAVNCARLKICSGVYVFSLKVPGYSVTSISFVMH